MIKFTLKCDEGHSFESWFQSADAYDKLRSAGHVACVHCGSTSVEKALMAPRVRPARKAAATQPSAPAAGQAEQTPAAEAPVPMGQGMPQEVEQALAKIRDHVETNSEYVGKGFASEARAIHLGDAPERPIYGEANAKEAKALIEDGVPVLPLPFRPKRKSN